MEPFVSAIMPVRGRQEWALQAVECFLGQTYQQKELLILEDFEEDPTFPLLWNPPAGVTLLTSPGRWTIGKKRNYLADKAAGDLIMHFDSDDWSAPERMADQAARMQDTTIALTGYRTVSFWDGIRGYLWRGQPDYVIGSSMCYRRDWWRQNQFPESGLAVDGASGIEIGSDNIVIRAAASQCVLDPVPGRGILVMRVHPNNSSKKHVNNYRKIEDRDLPAVFLAIAAAPARVA